MTFFPGLDDLHHARHFERCFISVNRLTRRRSDFAVGDWIMDSGAFTQISTHGRFLMSVDEYARAINRWQRCGNLLAAVSQDFMCEQIIIDGCPKQCRRKGLPPCDKERCFYGTQLSVQEHQARTIARYVALRPLVPGTYIMPVLQGYEPPEYVRHLRQYGSLIESGAWVGVGSVCKRNGSVGAIEDVLLAIKRERPDLRLHGFGLKTTALASAAVVDLLETADSMSWSDAARKAVGECARNLDRIAFSCPKTARATPEMKVRRKAALASARKITGRNAHDWREAARFAKRIETQPQQMSMSWEAA